jgi:CheY-like chemotaxis protein
MALKVLVVEDDAPFSYSVGRSLGQAGFEVVVAGDYLSALRALENQRIDLLLTDVVMPNVNGFALARMARLRNLDLKVLFMTAFDLPDEEAFAKVLRKPVTEEKLVEEVAHLLAA